MACPSKKSTLPLASRQFSLAVTVSTVSITSTYDDDPGPPRAITQIEKARALHWSVHPFTDHDTACSRRSRFVQGKKSRKWRKVSSSQPLVPPLADRGRWPCDETLVQPFSQATNESTVVGGAQQPASLGKDPSDSLDSDCDCEDGQSRSAAAPCIGPCDPPAHSEILASFLGQ